jgi:hypothetical protein
MVLSWSAVAVAVPSRIWVIWASWSADEIAIESTEPTLAATDASIGAATFAFAAMAAATGAAAVASSAGRD